MKDWFKVFLLRWKLRLFARDICRVHFSKMRLEERKIKGQWKWVTICLECERAKKVAQQIKAEKKHWFKEELEEACVEQRKKLGLPVTAVDRAVDEITNELGPVEPQPQPEPVWNVGGTLPMNGFIQGQNAAWDTLTGRIAENPAEVGDWAEERTR